MYQTASRPMDPSHLSLERLQQVLAHKAHLEPQFLESLMSSPHQTLAKMGLHIHPHVKIQVHKNSPHHVHVVLPCTQEELPLEWVEPLPLFHSTHASTHILNPLSMYFDPNIK